MLITISWCWIGVSAFLWGFAALHLMKKVTNYEEKSIDMTMLLGLCFLTVYAQLFSLFYKVGALASLVLLAINLAILLIWRKELFQAFLGRRLLKPTVAAIILILLYLMVLVLSSQSVVHDDTYLYHAQSIRWIEEYGVVPGLGNLHNRLAYNSAFFSLQALFSLRFLVGQSLHSVNGFFALFLITYAVFSMKAFRRKRFFPSDFLRFSILILYSIGYSYRLISSDGSDFLALGLASYILIKWVSYMEEGVQELAPYAYLCLLGVYATSVKISTAMLVLLALMPAVRLLRQKRWKEIAVYLLTGILIIAPFLARNVIICGYLLYPYETIDLFRVDWKMPAYTLAFDRNEIKAWAWGLKDVMKANTPITKWFPFWFSDIDREIQLLFVINAIAEVVAVVMGIYQGLKKKSWDFLGLVMVILANLLLWFFGAPSPRYGGIYMTFLPLLLAGMILQRFFNGKNLKRIPSAMLLILMICCLKPMIEYTVECDWIYKRRGADYDMRPVEEYQLGNEIIYVPSEGDQAGYYAFPSTPYIGRLDKIELRGDSLADGFRMKEEFREAYVSTYGEVYLENIFE